ncbi:MULTISPECIES: LacI family DNA-binding transcriptional regulator [unclassified Nocardiopsis]|uniref:LacI family DNA-binding transcriptional regulator n=1 Tax=unclassified Nocardiopsis TaxID=2649073 RepID=UPI00066B9BAE|nr:MULTISPECIES: LacI family DNA-binding transcriptional regulator [unclassified Nocardiopsis]MBQ1080540.1 LacI family DNA-binding transcriptional regulator [Nocardiopsis sp. B62]
MAKRRPTLAEIAGEAGVSVSTVSKVINGHLDVAAETRRQVERLLEHHRYQQRRHRKRRPVGLIDLVFLDLGSPWAMEILTGVEEVTHDAGFGVVVSAVHDRKRSRPGRRWLDNIQARRSDGVVLVLSELPSQQQEQLDALGVPVVLVDPVGDPAREIPAVGAANWDGGLTATEHLIGLGHRRVAMLAGPPDVMCSRARVDGYRSAMRDAGLPVPDGYVSHGDFLAGTGKDLTEVLLDLPEPPTAIFAGSDQMARGAYEVLYKRGLRVPDDVSVVGFDDLPEARWATPPLTTVRQPLRDMAQMATRMLFDLVNGNEPETTRVELATRLVRRDSTAPPKE